MNLCIPLRTISASDDSLCREESPYMKSISKKPVNARVVKFGKTQRDKNGITRCAIAVSNFSMWDKMLQNSVEKLQQENY